LNPLVERTCFSQVDEPMFLIGGGKPFAMKLSLKPQLTVTFDLTIEVRKRRTSLISYWSNHNRQTPRGPQ
jgi:hypothetical protein